MQIIIYEEKMDASMKEEKKKSEAQQNWDYHSLDVSYDGRNHEW